MDTSGKYGALFCQRTYMSVQPKRKMIAPSSQAQEEASGSWGGSREKRQESTGSSSWK